MYLRLTYPTHWFHMPRKTSTLLLRALLGLLAIGGCAGTRGGQTVTVSYDSESNQTTYSAIEYAAFKVSGSEYGSTVSITMQAVAPCRGANCTPDRAQLVFTSEGSERLSLSGVSGEIVGDGTRITWSDAEANPDFASLAENAIVDITGRFAVVDLPVHRPRQIATASALTGSIGGQSLALGSDVQSGLQKLLGKANWSFS